jgi:hypothetical protein
MTNTVNALDKGTWQGVQVKSGSASVVSIGASESALQNALVNGPVQVSVDASGWSNYQGGGAIIDGTGSDAGGTTCTSSSNNIDHAVQLVGYDTTGATPYWIVKNQWVRNFISKCPYKYIEIIHFHTFCHSVCSVVLIFMLI